MSYLINDGCQGMGLKVPVTAGENIGDHKLVYASSDGKWYLTDATSVSTMPSRGISCEPISENSTGEILLIGLISSTNWSWTIDGVNSLLYPSTQTGEITQTKPTQTGNQVQIIGVAITETLILFNPAYVLVEIA